MEVGTLRKIVNQTGFQLVGKVLSSLVTLFSLGLITTHYGTEGTGMYTLILTYLAFFYLAADLGLNAFALPLLDQSNKLFSKILGFRLLLAVVLIFLAIIGAFFVPDKTGTFFYGVVFGVISILGNAAFLSANLLFQKNFRYDLSVTSASITTLISGGLIWFMVENRFSVIELLTATSICWIVCALISLFFVRQYVVIRAEVDFGFIKQTLIKIWPISSTLLLNVFYFRVDTFMLNSFRSLGEVGLYNFAYQFFQTALVLPTFIMNVLYPLLLEKETDSPKETKYFILKAFVIMVTIGVLGSVVTWVISPVLIPLVAFKGGFGQSVYILQILGLSFPAFFGSAVLMWSLVTLNLNQKMFAIYAAGLILNIILNRLFIPEYSYFAAAWVTVVCEYVILLLQIYFVIHYYSRTLKK